MIKNGRSKDIRHYVGAVGVFLLVIGLLLFLSVHQIPKDNKDIFVSIVGMIVGSLSVVIYAVIGKNPDEVAQLQKKNESLQSLCDQMEKRNDQLEAMIIKIQEDIIDKLTLLGASAFDTIYNRKDTQ
jgi:predicted urease superfamily metal-dependent hydrolase|tara:strand:- start:385 stop:765 length:381 start_codon:yes stop_codon:yes gene_type:complete